MGASNSYSSTSEYMAQATDIKTTFDQELANAYGQDLEQYMSQHQRSSNDANIVISGSTMIGTTITIDQQINESSTANLAMMISASMNGESKSEDYNQFAQKVQQALEKTQETVAGVGGFSNSTTKTKEQQEIFTSMINETLLSYSNQIYGTVSNNIEAFQWANNNVNLSITDSNIAGTDISINQTLELETNITSQVSQQIAQYFSADTVVTSVADLDTSQKEEETIKTSSGISSAAIICIIILIVVILLFNGNSKKISMSGSTVEQAIYELKHNQMTFNIIMIVIFIIDVIIIVISAIQYDQNIKPMLDNYDQIIDDLYQQLYTAQGEDYYTIYSKIQSQEKSKDDAYESQKGWIECLVWTVAIGIGLILIDIIGNVYYSSQIKEWRTLVFDEQQNENKDIQQTNKDQLQVAEQTSVQSQPESIPNTNEPEPV